MMEKRRSYIVWGIVASAFGVVFSVVAAIGIVTGYLIPPFWKPELWLIPLGLSIAAALSVVAAVTLIYLGMRPRSKKNKPVE